MTTVKLLSDIIESFDIKHTVINDLNNEKQKHLKKCSFMTDPSIQYIYDINKIRNFVTKKICQTEQEYGFKVLFAVEKSSHIWGTAHPNSDNDIHCLMFYNQRSYYSLINCCAENSRNNQNKKVNLRNRKKLRERNEYKDNKFVRDLKIQYGDRFDSKNNIEYEDDKTLDVEITYHDIPKWMQLIKESNQSLYEMISSPLIYYHLYDIDYINCFRNIIWNLYDYIRLSESYYKVTFRNYKQLTHKNKNRCNRDPRKKVKTFFVIWRFAFMVEWLLKNNTVRNMPLYLPYLIDGTKLLNKVERDMLMNKLKNELNREIYNVDDVLDMLTYKVKGILNKLKNEIDDRKLEKKKMDGKKLKEQNEQELEKMVVEMIESYDKFGDVKMSRIEYNYNVSKEFPIYKRINSSYMCSYLLDDALQWFETENVYEVDVEDDELLVRMNGLISMTNKAIKMSKKKDKKKKKVQYK
eukprot:144114_1